MAGENNDFKIIIGADIADAKSKLKDLSNSLSSLSRNTGVASGSIGSSMGKISSLFSGLGATLSVASFGLFIKSALQTSAQLEQTAIAFEVFTGSALTAKNMLSELKDQALKSPMQFQDITKGAQILLGYGLTAQQVIPITKMLGDISGGNADKFSRLSLAFGQVNAAGRLMGQEARQMINAGFNPLQAISDKTGVSMAVLTKRMHDGQISVKDVGDAFTYATSEGGRFFGMADKQSQTLQGQFNKLSESTTFAMAEIGTSISENLQLGDVIAHLSVIIDQLKNSFIDLNKETNNASEFNRLLKGVLDILGITIDLGIKAWGLLTLALGGLLKLSTPVIDFFDKIDAAIIKWADTISTNMPNIASAVKGTLGYFNDFGKADLSPTNIVDSINKIKQEIVGLEESKTQIQISINPTLLDATNNRIAFLKQELMDLERTTGRYVGLTGLNNKPPGSDKKLPKTEEQKELEKAERARTAAFDKELTDNYKRQEKLIEVNKNIVQETSSIFLKGADKEISDVNKKFEDLKKAYEEAGWSIIDLVKWRETNILKIMVESGGKKQAEAIKSLAEETAGIKSEYPKQIGDFIKELEDTDASNRLRNFAQATHAATKDMAMSLAVGFGEIIGSVGLGEMGFKDSFDSLMGMIFTTMGDFLVKTGIAAVAASTAMAALKSFFADPLGESTLGLIGGIAAIATGTALKQMGENMSSAVGKAKQTSSNILGAMGGVGGGGGSSVSSKASGSSYQYGGSSYATQSIRLMVDLTGSITATQSGYSINKSLETTLRVTGR
jgi:tape measure domain-containing protein